MFLAFRGACSSDIMNETRLTLENLFSSDAKLALLFF